MNSRQSSSSEMWAETARPRIVLIVFVLLLWIIAVAARLVYLQTFQHDWLKDKALAQQQGVFKAGALRGLIVDRKGRELARSIEAESFFIVPSEVEDIDSAVKKLSAVIEIDKKEIAEQLKDGQARKSKFESIVRKVERETAEKIRSLNLKGVYSYKEPKRYYPNNDLAGDVLGFVNIDDVGISGLELSQNERLQGDAAKVLIEKDALRNRYESLSVSGRSGQTIVLTIDQMIQFYTQQAIAAAVQRTNSKSGTAIVLNVKTGEILAMANAPTFDPNNPREASHGGKDNDALQVYEPGSTFKVVTYSAAVEEGYAKPEQEVNCENGEYLIPGKVVKDTHRYGVLTFTQALAKSSNIAAVKLGQRLGNEKFYVYIKKFGFGAKTEIELPFEDSGLLRPVSKWSRSSIGSIPIGHEIGVTPLQIAAAYATIANNGVRVTPYLIKEVKTADNAIVYEAKLSKTQVVKNETAKTIQQMLMSVVSNGTGKKARIENYTVAGKTGTAQKINERTRAYSKSKYVASFIGFAPASNPEVVIAVILDEPQGAHTGGEVAAPVFGEIAEKVLPELNIAPDIDGDREIATFVDDAEEDFSEDTSGSDISVGDAKNGRTVERTEDKNLARPPNLGKEKAKR
jgi:cell division protein FtsI (penicillin-binding protein 3)